MIDDPLNGLIILISGHGEGVPFPALIAAIVSRENKMIEISALFITEAITNLFLCNS